MDVIRNLLLTSNSYVTLCWFVTELIILFLHRVIVTSAIIITSPVLLLTWSERLWLEIDIAIFQNRSRQEVAPHTTTGQIQ
jgi:hypothetical protein